MKTNGPVPVWHENCWHDRVVRHITNGKGTARIGMKVWNVIPVPDHDTWIVVNESKHSYFGGGRNARLLKQEG